MKNVKNRQITNIFKPPKNIEFMKKLFIITICAFGFFTSQAQSIDDVAKDINNKNYIGAKAKIDIILANPKNAEKAEAWYFKGRAYNSLSYDPSVSKTEAYQLKKDAFEAFKKYQVLDPKDLRLKLENHQSYLDLYLGYFDIGAQEFNEKNFDNSFNSFKSALDMKDFIMQRNYTYDAITFAALDTSLVLNTAIAAMQAKKDAEAMKYYKMLTDAEVGGPNYLDIYLFLAERFKEEKNEAALNDIIAKGKKLYPENAYWNQLEIDKVRESGDRSALYAQYDASLADKPNDFITNYNYAIELFNAVYGQEEKPKDVATAKAKITSLLKAAISSDEGIEATTLMANHYYNMAADESDELNKMKGTKPDEIAAKKAKKDKMMQYLTETIPFAEGVLAYYDKQTEPLTGGQKANYRIMLNHLSDIYSSKGDNKKADEYDARKAKLK